MYSKTIRKDNMKTRRILLVLLAIASGAFCTQGVSAQTTAKTATAKQVKAAKEATANIIQLSDTLSGSDIFRQIVAKYKGQPVLVDFWATWCGPCRMLSPVVDEVAEERTDVKVGKVNVDEQPDLAAQFGVMSIPTLLVFEQGKLVRQAVGARPKAGVLELLG